MAQAVIQLNGVTGSNPPNGAALPIGVAVACNNVNNGGEISYLWEFLDRPEGSAAVFSNPAIQNPSFTPDVEGTYLVRLTVNKTLASEDIDTVIAGIAHLKTLMRVPAALETDESSPTRGWALATNRLLGLVDSVRADPGLVVGVSGVALAKGDVVRVGGSSTIKVGLPGEETLPQFTKALATNPIHAEDALFVVIGGIDGAASVGVNVLVKVRQSGLLFPMLGAPLVDDPVYLSNTATLAFTPGTNIRHVGRVVTVSAPLCYIEFDGSNNASLGQADVRYGANVLQFGNSDCMGAADFAIDPGFGVRTSPPVAGNFPQTVIPFAGKLRNMYGRCDAKPTGGDIAVVVYVNDAPTAITGTFTAGAGVQIISNLVSAVTVAAGDRVYIRGKPLGALVTGALETTITLEYTRA